MNNSPPTFKKKTEEERTLQTHSLHKGQNDPNTITGLLPYQFLVGFGTIGVSGDPQVFDLPRKNVKDKLE